MMYGTSTGADEGLSLQHGANSYQASSAYIKLGRTCLFLLLWGPGVLPVPLSVQNFIFNRFEYILEVIFVVAEQVRLFLYCVR